MAGSKDGTTNTAVATWRGGWLCSVDAGGFALTRGITVMRLDDAGYRVRFVRGAGVQQARWTDVEDVVATTVVGERCVVLRLRDGRTTTLPVRLLATSREGLRVDGAGEEVRRSVRDPEPSRGWTVAPGSTSSQ